MENKKSPWNPSKRAIKRVKDPLPAPTECPHCFDADTGKPCTDIDIEENSVIYGRSYGDWPWIYLCCQCSAYVGMHPFTNIPLGFLADDCTRQARKRCKPVFEEIFKRRLMTRSEAYSALAQKLNIPTGECHFGWFDAEMCEKARVASLDIIEHA